MRRLCVLLLVLSLASLFLLAACGSRMEESTLDSRPLEQSRFVAEPGVQNYVLNLHSHKFHFPSCPGVENMKAANREDFTGTREELIARGYSPCGTCNP